MSEYSRFWVCLFVYSVLLSTLYSQSDQPAYSFFVAGHTYGAPGVNNVGFHPPFRASFHYIQGRQEIEFGILTGDIVSPFPDAQDWDEIDADIATLGLPVHFAVGNHDMENRPLFESRYGQTYYHFEYNNDIFIILDPNINGWSIQGAQLEFLKNLLAEAGDKYNHVFIFMHQLIWVEYDNPFGYIIYNSTSGKVNPVNFWTEVEPLLHQLPNQVVIFAGDLGASWTNDVTFDSYDNITLIASGMGDSNNDNYIVVNVDSNKSIEYDIICLDNGDICQSRLEEYQVVSSLAELGSDNLSIYPNPTEHNVFALVDGPNEHIMSVQLFDMTGVLVFEITDVYSNTVFLSLRDKAAGVYNLRVVTTEGVYAKRVVKQ